MNMQKRKEQSGRWQEVVYLKAERNVEVMEDDVLLKDMAKIYCADNHIAAKIKAIRVHRFSAEEQKRQVFSILKLIEMIQQTCPNVTVENLGKPMCLWSGWMWTDTKVCYSC